MSNPYDIAGRDANLKRDCTVRALHIASGIDYELCYIALAHAGRRNNCGARGSHWVKAFQAFNLCLPEHRVNLTHDAIPTDNVIVLIPGHIFAIKNGVHSDGGYAMFNNRKRIEAIYHIPSKG